MSNFMKEICWGWFSDKNNAGSVVGSRILGDGLGLEDGVIFKFIFL